MSISSDIAPLNLPSTPPTPSGIFSPPTKSEDALLWGAEFDDKENKTSSPQLSTSKLDAFVASLRDYASSFSDLNSDNSQYF